MIDNERKKRVLIALPIVALILTYIVGIFLNMVRALGKNGMSALSDQGMIQFLNPFTAIGAVIGSQQGRMALLIVSFGVFLAIVLFKWRDKALNLVDFEDDRGIIYAKSNIYGSARPLREFEVKEGKEDFEIGPVEKIGGYILGRLDDDNEKIGYLKKDVIDNNTIRNRPGKKTVAVKRERKGNYNILVVGGSGSGKSAGFVRANILQAVKAGESVVVTDPIGELYTSFYKTFTSQGIECKVFNLANPEYSDSWACLEEILDPQTMEPSDQRITDFSTIIIENITGQTKDPIHSNGQKQLLSAMIHALGYSVTYDTAQEYVKLLDEMVLYEVLPASQEWIKWARHQLSPNCKSTAREKYEIIQKAMFICEWDQEKKESVWKIHMNNVPELSLATVYHILSSHNKETLECVIEGQVEGFHRLPSSHPGRIAFHFFKNQNEKLKDGMLGSLGTNLQLLQDSNIRRILRNKDINLADAGDHQVVWFVIIPDQTTSTRVLSSLFFNFLFVDNAAKSDEIGARNRKRINFIMDEFANIGIIPNIDKKINIARGRNFSLCVILQDILQLDSVYGKEVAPVIISGCNTVVFLGSTNPETCEYFARLSGESTIVVSTVRNSRGVGRVEPLAKEYQESMGLGKRFVYTEHEIRTLPNEECLIWIKGYDVLRAKKFWWFTHPGSRTSEGNDLPEVSPKDRPLSAEKYAETERRDAFIAQDISSETESWDEPTGEGISMRYQSESPDTQDDSKTQEKKSEFLVIVNLTQNGKNCKLKVYSDGTAITESGEKIKLNTPFFERIKSEVNNSNEKNSDHGPSQQRNSNVPDYSESNDTDQYVSDSEEEEIPSQVPTDTPILIPTKKMNHKKGNTRLKDLKNAMEGK